MPSLKIYAMRALFSLALPVWLASISHPVVAQDVLLKIPTRQNVVVPVYWMPREGATQTLLLLPGGGGGIGKVENGKPASRNFLVRSSDLFAAQRMNVAVVSRPSDTEDLTGEFRLSAAHVEDLRKVVAAIKAKSSAPLWLVGTSRGTISATAAAIAMGEKEVAGLVLSSSVTNFSYPGALGKQDLAAIRLPVLVIHHEKDACPACRPFDVPGVIAGLKNAGPKKAVMVKGGANPTGGACEALNWHGYIGMEAEAVRIITEWIKNPLA